MEDEENVTMKGGQNYQVAAPKTNDFLAGQINPTAAAEYIQTRRGIGICIITRGTVPIKWSMHLNEVSKCFPGGLFWKFLIVERMSWAAARSECVRKCRANNFEWLMFVDDDVFIPKDCLQKMMAAGKKVISGIYWTKTEHPAPVIFEEFGKGPMFEFEPDRIIPIAGSGLGCTLIHMDVFDKFDEKGLAYFVENWVFVDPLGQKMKCPIGEDHYFFLKAKEVGFQPYAHTGILCDHYDYKEDKFFPGEDIVRDFCKTQLKKAGREDIVKDYDHRMLDTEKKTIVIYNDVVPFAGDEIARRGVGGSEGDIIYLAREFARLGTYNVRVYCRCLREGFYDNVLYRDNKKMFIDMQKMQTDLFISSRNLQPFFDPDFKQKHNVAQSIYWAHDISEDPMSLGMERAIVDKIVALTEYHKQDLINAFKLDPKKIIVIPNGVDINRYKDRANISKIHGKCIYSSTPYRGLDVLLRIWPTIRLRVPHAELSIFSSIKVYGEFFDDSPWEDLYAYAKRLEGIKYHGSVKHDRLAKEQMEAQLCLYPNHFPETCCVTAMECQTAGTPIITTDKAGLRETIKPNCGILIGGEPHNSEYQQAFIDAAVDLLIDPEKYALMQQECYKHDFSWATLAKQWLSKFLNLQEIVPIQDWDKVYIKELERQQFHIDNARFNYLKQFVKGQHDRVLDIGCGLGAFPRFLRQAFPKIELWGHELSMFAQDHNRQSDKTILFANHPIEAKDYEAEYFDLIFCQHVLQHAQKPDELLATCKRLIKPHHLDGKIVVVVPKAWNNNLVALAETLNFEIENHGITGTADPDIIAVIQFNPPKLI